MFVLACKAECCSLNDREVEPYPESVMGVEGWCWLTFERSLPPEIESCAGQ